MPPPRTTTGRARRLRRVLACAATIAGVLLTTAGTGRADPYSAPVPLPALTPSTLGARYAIALGRASHVTRTSHR